MRKSTIAFSFVETVAGFTLVELLYVLIILGILAGVAVPRIDVDRFRMNSAAIEVATSLAAAQRSAVLRGHDIVVAMDLQSNRLRIHTDANNDGNIQAHEEWKVLELPEGTTFGLVDAPALSSGTTPTTFLDHQGTFSSLTFHRNGSASEKGFIYLTGAGGGASGKNSRAIEVVRATARVKCWSHHSGSWKETC
jgi:prepilin-type N-terminal cleavage/methylation domain-containing protein